MDPCEKCKVYIMHATTTTNSFTIISFIFFHLTNLHIPKELVNMSPCIWMSNMVFFPFNCQKFTNYFFSFYSVCPWGLICSFLTSLFNRTLVPSTFPLPWPVAKKFQIISQHFGNFVDTIKQGYWKQSIKLLLT